MPKLTHFQIFVVGALTLIAFACGLFVISWYQVRKSQEDGMAFAKKLGDMSAPVLQQDNTRDAVQVSK